MHRTYACVVDSLLGQHTMIPFRLLHDINKHRGRVLFQDPDPQASHHKEIIQQQVCNAGQRYLQAVCFDVCPECVQDGGASGLLHAQHCRQGR